MQKLLLFFFGIYIFTYSIPMSLAQTSVCDHIFTIEQEGQFQSIERNRLGKSGEVTICFDEKIPIFKKYNIQENHFAQCVSENTINNLQNKTYPSREEAEQAHSTIANSPGFQQCYNKKITDESYCQEYQKKEICEGGGPNRKCRLENTNECQEGKMKHSFKLEYTKNWGLYGNAGDTIKKIRDYAFYNLNSSNKDTTYGRILFNLLSCDWVNTPPRNGSNFNYDYRYGPRATMTALWDEKSPECHGNLSNELRKVLQKSGQTNNDKTKEELTTIFERTKNKSTIHYYNGGYWNGDWSHEPLYFTPMCWDEHSGCNTSSTTQSTQKLYNRQENIQNISFKDNVENESNSCVPENKTIKSIKKHCTQRKTHGILQPKRCYYTPEYNSNSTNNTMTKFAIYDNIPPKISVLSSQNTSDNIKTDFHPTDGKISMQNNKTRLRTGDSNKLSFYAGKITLNISLEDFTPNASIDGVSGIESFIIDIKDKNGTSLYSKTGINFEGSKNRSGTKNAKRKNNATLDKDGSMVKILNWETPIYKAGKYTLQIGAIDYAGNKLSHQVAINIIPNFTEGTITDDVINEDIMRNCGIQITTINLPQGCEPKPNRSGYIHVTPHTGDQYADGGDTKAVTNIILYDKYFNIFSNTQLKGNFSQTQTHDKIFLDQVSNPQQGDAVYNTTSPNGQTNPDGKVTITTISYAPGEISQSYTGEICYFDYKKTDCTKASTIKINFGDKNQKFIFQHILNANIKINKRAGGNIYLGTENNAYLELSPNPETNTNPRRSIINNFIETLAPTTKNYQLTNKGEYKIPTPIPYTSINQKSTSFTAEQIKTEDNFSSQLDLHSKPYITINIQGSAGTKTAKYYLAHSSKDFSNQGLTYKQGELNRIYIQGHKQAIGKEKYVTNAVNIYSGNINSTEIRNNLYRNASYITRNRSIANNIGDDSDIYQGIKYMKNQQAIRLDHENYNWDTLIAYDSNVIIDTKFFNEDKNKQKAIILINSNKGDISKGNIYITPKVQYIGAHIFTDASIISVDDRGDNFTKTNEERAKVLQNQIVFYGSIFSRNTIAGAVKGGGDGKYIFPNLLQIPNKTLTEAIKYDLSYLRMGNKGFNNILKNKNQGREESVVIIQDPRIFTQPLSIFSFRE